MKYYYKSEINISIINTTDGFIYCNKQISILIHQSLKGDFIETRILR